MRTVLVMLSCSVLAGVLGGCAGRDGARSTDAEASEADVYFAATDTLKGQVSEVGPLSVLCPQSLPWVRPTTIEIRVGGDSYSAAYSSYSAPNGQYVRYKFRTTKGKIYVEELSARRWDDDPDIYASRSSTVSPSNYTWCSLKRAHYPDTGGFKSGASGWCYLAVYAYSGTGGEAQWRIRVYTGS